ncbi:MAG TPA: hypothetical protein VE360_07940 [Pyrinomonadaceae bacterium]|jgi:DNA anti-recombination protein RmuC|nr:hypothetical protein [Pyrinomonadaceae bacterium]
MADTEVENVLREIRERVRAESATHAPLTTGATAALDEGDGGDSPGAHVAGAASAALARMEANLATTERTWNRLPPLVSNRTGWPARLELWAKRKIKRAAHWFTWEQVNFNSSVYHALRDAVAALTDHERRLAETRAQFEAVSAELSSLRQSQAESESRLAAHRSEAAARLAAIEARVGSEVAALRAALDSGLTQLRDEQRAQAAGTTAERLAHIADLQRELRERAEHILDELRVSFRQLSLEAGEAAVAHDRARRQIEARVEAIEKEVMRTEERRTE